VEESASGEWDGPMDLARRAWGAGLANLRSMERFHQPDPTDQVTYVRSAVGSWHPRLSSGQEGDMQRGRGHEQMQTELLVM